MIYCSETWQYGYPHIACVFLRTHEKSSCTFYLLFISGAVKCHMRGGGQCFTYCGLANSKEGYFAKDHQHWLCWITFETLMWRHCFSGWPPGIDLGHPADATSDWGSDPCVHSCGGDQPDPVVVDAARLDRDLLQQLHGDPACIAVVSTAVRLCVL